MGLTAPRSLDGHKFQEGALADEKICKTLEVTNLPFANGLLA